MTEWIKYTGSPEQISEIRNSKYGWLARVDAANDCNSIILDEYEPIDDIQSIYCYLICNPHPLADMICQQARTGQPVWWKYKTRQEVYPCLGSPDWDDVNCEYSFTEFKEGV